MTEASALLRLQQIDIELLRHASTLQKLPQQEKLKKIALAKKKVAVELKKITGQRKDVEIDIVDVNADISHYRQVRERVMAEAEEGPLTHREARTVEESLTHLAKVTEKCEFRLGPLNEKLEKLKLAEANAQKMLGRLDEEEAATKKSFEDDSASVRAQILKLKDERDAAWRTAWPRSGAGCSWGTGRPTARSRRRAEGFSTNSMGCSAAPPALGSSGGSARSWRRAGSPPLTCACASPCS